MFRSHRSLHVGVLALVLLALAVAGLPARSAAQADPFAVAHQMHLALDRTPIADRQPADYERIVSVLAPLWRQPQAPGADSARYEASSVYVALARDLNDPAAYTRAARLLLDLLHQTPYSAYRRNAEWALAQIQMFHLHERAAAVFWLRDFERRYPADPRTGLAHDEIIGRHIAEPPFLESAAVVPSVNPPNAPPLTPLLPPQLAAGASPPSAAGLAPPPPAVTALGPAPPRAPSPPPAERQVALALRAGDITGIRVFSNRDGTSVVITLLRPTRFGRGALPREHIVYFDIPDPAGRRGLLRPMALPVHDGRITSIQVAAHRGFTRIAIGTAPGARADRGRLFPNPERLIVGVGGVALALRAAPVSPPHFSPALPPARLANGRFSLTRALGLQLGTVVLDPGHGGYDTGTVSRSGLEEKNVVLDVALRLGRLLRAEGLRVVYTRDTDTFVPLEQRTAIANRAHADLFVSIHANASRDPAAAGIETYYLNLTQDPHALAVAARENAGSQLGIHDLNPLVERITADAKMQESRQLAADLQRDLVSATHQQSRGVKSAPFVVLIGARMPSVLVELSFLSNPGEARDLGSPAYRQQLAQALNRGILQYDRSLGGRPAAVASLRVPAGGGPEVP